MYHKKIFAKVIHACPYFASIKSETEAWRNFYIITLFHWKLARYYPAFGLGIILTGT
jgi:hypothetical protein